MSTKHEVPANSRAIFWICVLALTAAAMSLAIRVGVSGAMKEAMLDPFFPENSGALIGLALGNSFMGFAFAVLIVSPLLDIFGSKKVILFAALCYIAGPLLIIFAPNAGDGDAIFTMLNIGMIVCGLAWGSTEAAINPLTTAIYPDDKTGKLNILHAWWPGGWVIGGLATAILADQMGVSWQILVGLIMIPGALCGLWALTQSFPQTESTVKGVSFGDMMAEPFKRPTFWIFPAIMLLTASAELAPGAWVDITLSETVGMSGILVMVYVSAIMFVMRHFAGPLERKFSDMGLLCVSTIPAAIGLYALSLANSPLTALFAATFWAVGVCFMWPTMLAAVARRYPDSGPWGIGIVGFAGAMAIRFVLPELGKIYDAAKLQAAGGAEAYEALTPGSEEMQKVLAFAGEQSFQVIALIPLALLVIFGVVWLFERSRNKPLGAPEAEAAE